MNSFKRVRAFQILLEFGSVGFWEGGGGGGNRSTRTKTSRSKGEKQQQPQPTYGVDAGIWTRVTTAPPSRLLNLELKAFDHK